MVKDTRTSQTPNYRGVHLPRSALRKSHRRIRRRYITVPQKMFIRWTTESRQNIWGRPSRPNFFCVVGYRRLAFHFGGDGIRWIASTEGKPFVTTEGRSSFAPFLDFLQRKPVDESRCRLRVVVVVVTFYAVIARFPRQSEGERKSSKSKSYRDRWIITSSFWLDKLIHG